MKTKLITLSFLLLFSTNTFAQDTGLTNYVDPLIGSEGLGRVFIGPSCPYGMVKPSPDCTPRPNSGWLPMPEQVDGFSQVHVSGTGGGPKYGNILVMPFCNGMDRINHIDHRKDETIKLGYYSTQFQSSGIQTEITTAPKASFYRFTYPKDSLKSLAIDAGFFLGESPVPDAREAQQFVGSEIQIISDHEVIGYTRIRGGWNNGRTYTVYFYAETDKPFVNTATWKSDKITDEKFQYDSHQKTGALLRFNSSEDVIQLKVGISFLSSLKARQNAHTDIPHWSFETVHKQLLAQWEDLLQRIEISPRTPEAQKRMFYTGLYHTMIMPVDRSGENPLWADDEPYYDDFYAIWDTYRTSTPLITLIDPKRETDIVRSLINIYKRDGYMPDARSGNSNGRTQGGSNAEIVIADAFVKGLEGIDYELGLQAMLKDATVCPGDRHEAEGRGGLIPYLELGYIPYGIPRAGNRTVEYSYCDYAIALVAKGLGKEDLYQHYLKQSGNWKNLWRGDYEHAGAKGFILPRDEKGNWLDEITFGKSKNWGFSVMFQGVNHVSRYYDAEAMFAFVNGGKVKEHHLDRWNPSKSEAENLANAKYPRLHYDSYGNHNQRGNSFFLKNGAFMRLKNIELSYTLPTLWAKKVGMSDCRLYVNANNLITWDDLDGLTDPESNGSNRYPIMKTVNFGVNIKF